MTKENYYSSESVLGMRLFPGKVLKHYKPRQLDRLKEKAKDRLDIIKSDSRRSKNRIKDIIRFCKQIDKTKLCLE